MKYMTKLIDITGKALSGEWGTEDDSGIGIPVLRTTNFTNEGIVDYSDVVTRTITKKNIAEKYLRLGDIIIEKSGGSDKFPVGRVIYFDGPDNKYLFNNFTGLLRVKDPQKWNQKYVFYALFSNYKRGGTRAFENKTTGLHNLKTDDYVARFEIKEVPYNQQVSVCRQLDKLFYIIQQREQEISLMDDLIKARFVELYNSSSLSKETTIEAITECVKVGFVGTCEKYYTDNSGIPMLRTGNITNNGIDLSDLRFVTQEFHEKNKKSQIHEGDLLIARHGANGQANVYYGPEAQCLNAVVIVPNYEITTSVYLAELINSPIVKEQIGRTLVGSTQHVINTKSIASLVVRIPNINTQMEYETFVKQVNKSKSAVQKSLAQAQLLFDSIMQSYFG